MKKIKILVIILLISILMPVIAAPSAMALDDPEVTSNAIILTDLTNGRVFFSRNENERVYPASLTKIMTVLLAVEAIEKRRSVGRR